MSEETNETTAQETNGKTEWIIAREIVYRTHSKREALVAYENNKGNGGEKLTVFKGRIVEPKTVTRTVF